jgi:S-adenosylmethionine:tRNA ribosyltransferase-isomerase
VVNRAVRTADFDYHLPPELIAQEPASQRDQSRLLVLDRRRGVLSHQHFCDLPSHLRAGDLLVLNDSRVLAARLRGLNTRTGGQFEILLLEEVAANDWWAMMRPGKRASIGAEMTLQPTPVSPGASQPPGAAFLPSRWAGRVTEVNAEGHRRLRFSGGPNLREVLDLFGEAPLPPYIARAAPNLRADDRERYQTIYARTDGSVAAPTAGLHFTAALLENLRVRGVELCFLTLHVGLGTFAPVKAERVQDHVMHEEWFCISAQAAEQIRAARQAGRRIVAVGTTTVRVLESVAARHQGEVVPDQGRTRIFIHPPCRFQAVDGLISNFHLPRSTLLMLVSAFAAPGENRGIGTMLGAYREAVRERYRFHSYGDAMLIL